MGRNTASAEFHFISSSKVRPGSALCSTTLNRLSPETTTATRRTVSNGRAAGREGGGGADEAQPLTSTTARTSRTAEARDITG